MLKEDFGSLLGLVLFVFGDRTAGAQRLLSVPCLGVTFGSAWGNRVTPGIQPRSFCMQASVPDCCALPGLNAFLKFIGNVSVFIRRNCPAALVAHVLFTLDSDM